MCVLRPEIQDRYFYKIQLLQTDACAAGGVAERHTQAV